MIRNVSIGGTTLSVHQRGTGPALLLIHGGGEDASMLAEQAAHLASAGYTVVTYDRRGTGRSGRDGWPGSGAPQHADDAASLLDALGIERAVVVGLSSGGVIGMTLAARHPARVTRVIAWEPPALGVVPGAETIYAQIMAPVHAYLADYPGDWLGAQEILLSMIAGRPVTSDDPAFAAARANAEPMVRDEPNVTLGRLDPEAVAAMPLTVGLGREPNDVIAAAAEVLMEWTGVPAVRVDAEHEVYLSDPSVLTGIVSGSAREPEYARFPCQ